MLKDSLERRSVITYGITSTSATVQVDISKFEFSANFPIFLYGAYRTESAATNDGFCIIKMYNNKIYVCGKVGLGNFGEVSMNSSGTTLTITCGSYMSLALIGYPKNN